MAVSASSRTWLLSGALGAFAFCAVQIPLLLVTPPVDGINAPGWFLNSRQNILVVVSILFTGATVLCFRKQASDRDAMFYGIGAITAMLVTLFAIGPGTIFPIVIAFGGTIVSVVVFAGASFGHAVRARLTGKVPGP